MRVRKDSINLYRNMLYQYFHRPYLEVCKGRDLQSITSLKRKWDSVVRETICKRTNDFTSFGVSYISSIETLNSWKRVNVDF
jgi:hypothetical protein